MATLCEFRGWHVRAGAGTGTSIDTEVWSDVCRDCGCNLGHPDLDGSAVTD